MAVQGQPKEKMCPQCFEINPASSTFCTLCGASLAEGKEANEGSDTEVYNELAKTNLLRMRGQYKDAIQVCLGILKKYPNNATAHTLLGDVHAEMNELAQAAEWYEMALDLSPNSDADKQKLMSVRKRIQDREKAQTAEQIGLAEANRPKPGAYIAAAAAGILLVGTCSFVLGQMMTSSKPKPAVTQPVSVGDATKPAAVSSDQKGEEGKGAAKEEETPSAPAPVPMASAPASPDRTTVEFLKTRGQGSTSLFAAVEDPRTKHLTVSAELPGTADATMTAVGLVNDVFTLIPEIDKVTVKLIQAGNSVYLADATRTDYQNAMANLSPNQAVGDAAANFLTNTWPAAQ